MFKTSRSLIVATGVALATACVGLAIATAAIPDAAGVITACYNASAAGNSGMSALMIKDTANGGCPKGDVALTWNQRGPQGAQGPQGLPGVQGPQGVQGPAGPAGAAGTVVRRVGSALSLPNAGDKGDAQVSCDPGQHVTGGGYLVFDVDAQRTATDVLVSQSAPLPGPDSSGIGWLVTATNRSIDAVEVTAYALCG